MNIQFNSVQSPSETPRFGEFTVSGLLPGMGTVVGTAMRRTLLSSVPGAAVEWMRIEGVAHEFSTVPGVREDVSEILLRVKRLVLRANERGVHRLTLEAAGRDALAGDLAGDGGVDVVEPEYVIAHLGPKAVLKLELLVREGRDHAMNGPAGSVGGQRERMPIGMIYADPVYSPVEKVAVDVEPDGERETLRLRVWTNGAVSPRQAVDWAGRVMEELTGQLAALEASAPAPEPVRPMIIEQGQPLENLGLSNRTYNRLRRAHFESVDEVVRRSRRELCDMPELGEKTVQELEVKLRERGLSLRTIAS